MKQPNLKYKQRYRFRISGVDLSKKKLDELDGFKIVYAKNMDVEDIAEVERDWDHKIIRES